MTYQVGDAVTLWDQDLEDWIPGVIDGVSDEHLMVKTDASVFGLPMIVGMPVELAPFLLVPRDTPGAGGV